MCEYIASQIYMKRNTDGQGDNTQLLLFDKWTSSIFAITVCDRSAEDAYSSMAPDPTFSFVGGPCYPTLDFECVFSLFWIMITFKTYQYIDQ
jgi:hypothetical protein